MMNKLFEKLKQQATEVAFYSPSSGHTTWAFNEEKFFELVVCECIAVASAQRGPANLNYKPSERFVEDLKLHFGIK